MKSFLKRITLGATLIIFFVAAIAQSSPSIADFLPQLEERIDNYRKTLD